MKKNVSVKCNTSPRVLEMERISRVMEEWKSGYFVTV